MNATDGMRQQQDPTGDQVDFDSNHVKYSSQGMTSPLFLIIGSLTTCLIALLILLFINNRLQRRRLAQRIADKRRDIFRGVALIRQRIQSSGTSVDKLVAITQYSLQELQQKLRDKSLRPVDILHAYQHKALKLFDAGNSGICQFIVEAEEWANSIEPNLDQLLEEYPLAGIPISVKETNGVKGYDGTFGLAKRCGHPCQVDSILIQTLKSCGLVPFAVTVACFAGLDMTGFNPVFGNLSNPYKTSHCPGGSSTGDCVLVSQGGSLLGLGADRFGSLRNPAGACGLVALKPSERRLSNRGCIPLYKSTSINIDFSLGPVATSVNCIADFMRTALCGELFHLDHHAIPLVFNERLYGDTKRLTIGYYHSLNHPIIPRSAPSVAFAVQHSVDQLRCYGHRLVPFQPPQINCPNKLLHRCAKAGGKSDMIEHLAYENIIEDSPLFLQLVTSLPVSLSRLLTFVWDAVKNASRWRVGNRYELSSVGDAFDLLEDLESYRSTFAEAWNMAELDVLICPFVPITVPPKSVRWSLFTNTHIYACLYNLVDYCVGMLPRGLVNEESMAYSSGPSDNTTESEKLDVQRYIDDQERGSIGLPLTIQVITPPGQEELVLRVMRELEQDN